MTAELSLSLGGIAEMAYAASGGTPWHGLGQALAPGLGIAEWQLAAGMAWTIESAPVQFTTSPAEGGATLPKTFPDKRVLFRSDSALPLSIVSSSYQIVQPREVLEFFRDLTESLGFALETAGTLFDGKKFWALARITADCPIVDLADQVGGYLLLSTSCDGSMATEVRYTTIRVVCNNTLRMARSGAVRLSVTHRSKWNPAEVKQQLGLTNAKEQFEDQINLFRKLAATPMTPSETAMATAKLLAPVDAARMAKDELIELLETKAANQILHLACGGAIGSDLSGTTGTAWGWLNAVSEYVDHDARSKTRDGRLNSAWFGRGDQLKERAFELVAANGQSLVEFRREATDGLLDSVLAASQG
jgi:phage/plasmid-like protein (TIGR03299 family)